MMEEDTNRLTRLIDDILELSKIESKTSKLELERVDLYEIITSVNAILKPSFEEQKITLENRLTKGAALHVLADRDKLKQILINLTHNAIKFNHEGGRVMFQAEDQGKQIALSIEDTGIGISENQRGRIFERFFRLDKGRSRELGGTGLGLAIVKHLVEAHHGAISCQSEPGKGSTFTLTLPIAKTP